MQELLLKISRQLDALLTPSALLQLSALAIAALLAWWFGMTLRNTPRARAAMLQLGPQARVTEALFIASPHMAAVVLIAAFGGILHALQAESRLIDLGITLAALLLIIRVIVYLVRLALGNRTKGW